MTSKVKGRPRKTPKVEQGKLPARAEANERWAQISEATTKLFRRKGFTSTTMQDVADAIGILKGSLYYYFKSKEDLLFKILIGLHKDGEEIVASVQFNSADPLQQLRTYLKRTTIFAAKNADRLSIFLADFHYVPAERQREIISERDLYANTVRSLVAEAKRKGLTQPDLDVGLASKLISGAVSSTHVWLRPDGPRPLEEVAEEIADMLTNTIRASVQTGTKRRVAAA
jgi:AcrR family transcriptional regulator